MITDTAAKKIYSAENICGLALEPCFKGSDFLNGTSKVAWWRHNWLPESTTIISGGFAYIVSDFGFLVTVNRLVNLQVWADAKLRKKYSQVPWYESSSSGVNALEGQEFWLKTNKARSLCVGSTECNVAKLDQKLGSATCKDLGNHNGMLKTSKGGFRGLQNPGHSRPTLIQVHTERCVHFWAKKVWLINIEVKTGACLRLCTV